MTKSCCLTQIIAALRSVVAWSGVASSPQLIARRNTKFGPDLVETGYLVRHRLALDFFLRGYSSEV
jgi:hypothetical protein